MVIHSNSETTQAINEIREALSARIKTNHPEISANERDYKVDEILKIHGLHPENFNVIARMEEMLDTDIISDKSIDDNSNKGETGVGATFIESVNSQKKLIGYRYLYRSIKKIYGKEEAKRLTGMMYDYSLGLADSSQILLPYCWAGDFSMIVLEGRSWGQLHSNPPKTLRSYISALIETVHTMSNHTAGAIAISSFFTDSAKMLMDREGVTLEQLKEPETRKYIENSFQSFVHSMNSLTRSGSAESPFTNLSIFDKPKNMQKALDLDYYFDIQDPEYISEFLMEIQRIYMNFFSTGDPTQNGIMYRFPVSTINITKDNKGNIVDPQFMDEIVEQEIFRYNIFVSEKSKDASCCRMLSSEEMLALGAEANSFGGGGIGRLGSHRVVTLDYFRISKMKDSLEEYLTEVTAQLDDSCKVLKAHRELILDLEKKGKQPFITRGYIDMTRMFSTFGVLGIVEAGDVAEVKYGIQKNIFIETVLKRINALTFELAHKYSMPVNLEQIPAESFSHRIPNVNKILLGEENVPYALFSNQFVPMWEDATLWERMEADGGFNKFYTGGGIVHFSLSERTTPSQNKKIIQHAIATGCEHFSLNPVYSVCKDCGSTTFANLTQCNECSSTNIVHLTRTVGFFTEVETGWSKPKREHDFKKRVYAPVE